jgi:zinc transporter
MEPTKITYGSDKHGLVWAYQFAPGRSAVEIGSEQALALIDPAAAMPPESFLWLHFSLANAAAEGWLRRHLDLPVAFFDSLTERANSTRLEQDGDMLVAVVHDALFDFTFDPESVSTVCLCMTPRLLVTARLRPVRSVDLLRSAVRAGQDFRSPADLLAQLLRHQADVLADIVRASSLQVNQIEDKLLADRITASRRELGALRRTHVRLQRLLAPEPAAMFRLLSRSPGWIDAHDLQELRLAAEEFAVAIADSGGLVERVKLLQEELGALVGEQTSRTLFVLTVVTVLALPVNLVAGLFGMNVGGIPFASHPHGFFLVAGAVVSITLIAAYLALGRRKD